MVSRGLLVDKFLVFKGGRTLTLSKTTSFGVTLGSDSPSSFESLN